LKILGLDIGAGTKDVFLYNSDIDLENCVKMVLPSPTILYSNRLHRFHGDLYIDGYAIGGGNLAVQLKKHIAKGYSVFMTKEAAFTLYNRIERVKALGIKIAERPPDNFKGVHLRLDEVNLNHLAGFLSSVGASIEDLDGIAIAVQDHGVPPKDIGQNKFRLMKFHEYFSQKPKILEALFSSNEVPDYYIRMRSAIKSASMDMSKKIFVMDSTLAAVAGCIYASLKSATVIVAVNIGNSHTTSAIVREGRIAGFMEHHTSLLTPRKLERLLNEFMAGELRDEAILEDGGHGGFYLSRALQNKDASILVTGPRRSMMKETNLKSLIASPTGDVMMTGVFGLVKATERKLLS